MSATTTNDFTNVDVVDDNMDNDNNHVSGNTTNMNEDNHLKEVNDRNLSPEEPRPKGITSNVDYSFWEKRSVVVANRPCTHLCTALILSLGIGIMGLIVGGFAVTVEGAGWVSRGTLIADRHMQFAIIDFNSYALFNDKTGDVWSDLTDSTNADMIYFTDDDDGGDANARSLQQERVSDPRPSFETGLGLYPTKGHGKSRMPPFAWHHALERRLQEVNGTGILEGCDISWYTSDAIFFEERIWPIWRLKRNKQSASFLESAVFQELCEQEEITQTYLVENDLCFGCNTDDKCLQPYSLVLFARLLLADGANLGCRELSQAWASYVDGVDLASCVNDLKTDYSIDRDGQNYPASCPDFFSPTMLDEFYDDTERIQYTSSIFATTYDDIDALYDGVGNYARGRENIEGAYDTQAEDFVNLALEDQLIFDMSLALASAFITFIAMVIHTRSLFLAGVGLLQISLSFPLAYTFYKFIAQLDFFPFLNFIGVFVIFALGADDVFVAVDKWKNARLLYPKASVQDIATVAFPDAASAMLLTTATTSVAFFGTAVCPVAPIRCFAVFVGLLVVFDYLLCVLLVFPALVIYDTWRCCCIGRGGHTGQETAGDGNPNPQGEGMSVEAQHGIDAIDTESNLIRRVLSNYYKILHTVRWPLLLLCGGALIWTAVKASKIGLPLSSDVRLYDEEDNQYEQNFVWRQKILFDVLQRQGGSTAYVIWGVIPEDNGNLNNPDIWSKLVLDESFTPSNEEVQVFLRDFCDDFFSNDFAGPVETGYQCPINAFDFWLQEQASSENPDPVYLEYCDGASALPTAEAIFDACMYAWGQQANEVTVLARDGKISVMYIKFNSRIRYDSPFDDIDNEWNTLENYMDNLNTPDGAKNGYFTSEDYWWYDTNGQMLRTAFTSAAIAMGAAAAAILFSSRSLVLTIFSTVTVGYVLASVTATLYALGWTIGFLEAVLFAILIGISCDFVIHFSHSYGHQTGEADRSDRTKFALITMGPSILAAAFTTFAAATVMLFTIITFFEKFAVVLFMTVLQATIGSFVVFLTITDCIGPTNPTYLFDRFFGGGRNNDNN